MTTRADGPLVIYDASAVWVRWRIGNGDHAATSKQVEYGLKMAQRTSVDAVRIAGCWLDESDLAELHNKIQRVAKSNREQASEWNAEAVEAQHRFRTDDARADYIADNYSPEDWS